MSTKQDIRYEHLRESPLVEELDTPSLTGLKKTQPTEVRQFPPISDELVEALDILFSEQSPREFETHAELMWRGGQRSVVRWLHAERKAQLKGAS